MQEIIVYRNPAEAAFWNLASNGQFFPIIAGIVVGLIVMLVLNHIATKFWPRYSIAMERVSFMTMAIGAVAAVAVGRWLWI